MNIVRHPTPTFHFLTPTSNLFETPVTVCYDSSDYFPQLGLPKFCLKQKAKCEERLAKPTIGEGFAFFFLDRLLPPALWIRAQHTADNRQVMLNV